MGLLLALAVLIVFFWPKIWAAIQHYRRLYHYASKMPGAESPKMIWELLRDCRTLADCHDALARGSAELRDNDGHDIVHAWLFNRLLISPLTGKAAKNIVESAREISKSIDYDGLRPWLGTGLLMATGDAWRTRRRLLTPTFHFTLLEAYFDTYNRHSQIMIDVIERRLVEDTAAGRTKGSTGLVEMDVVPYIKRFGLDVVYESVMGVPLNTQLNPDNAYSEAMESLMAVAASTFLNPLLRIQFFRRLFGVEVKYMRALGVLKAASNQCIIERKAARAVGDVNCLTEDRPCFLDQLLDLVEKEHMEVADVSDEVDTFMFGGHDTATNSVSWALWCLACHPDVQQKAFEEVAAVFEEDPTRPCTSTDIANMPYLEQVIKETLRLYPPVPIVLRELEEDLEMEGYTVPRGATIFISFFVLQRNKNVFPNPNTFDPENFSVEKVATRDPHDFMPFSAGPRNCIGQRFARNEMKVLLSSLLRKFRFSTDRTFESIKGSPEIIFRPKDGIRIFVEKR